MPATTGLEQGVPQSAPKRRHVFISYSHADSDWLERLKRMMAPLLRDSGHELRLWDDSQIKPGEKWREEIETALAQAEVALLLVSDHFLASEYVMGEEVPKVLAAAKDKRLRVLWVSLTSCLVDASIKDFQAVLPHDRPLDKMAEAELNEALKKIGEEIRKALQPPQGAAAPPAPTPAPEAPLTGELQTFSVTTAKLLQVGGVWKVERRNLEVRGRRLELGDGVSLPLIAIPAGEFVMGSPADEPERLNNEGPQHRVRLQGFLMGQTPVTQAQWRAVARLVPPLGQTWQTDLPLKPRFADQPDSDQRPVEPVLWHEANEFCRRLASTSGDAYTLPSEAQWEYACRAGSTTPFAFGETISPELANYDGVTSYANGPMGEYRKQSTPVGMFPANAWGLHDMHGNVWEWCLDHGYSSYEGAPFDGSAWMSMPRMGVHFNDQGIMRGGSRCVEPGFCRSAYRNFDGLGDVYLSVGLRVVCLPQAPT